MLGAPVHEQPEKCAVVFAERLLVLAFQDMVIGRNACYIAFMLFYIVMSFLIPISCVLKRYFVFT